MAKKVWSDQLKARLIGMYRTKKFSTGEMANALGVSQPTVYNHLRRLKLTTTNLPRRHRAAVKFEFSEAERKEIIRLHRHGKYFTEIALALGRTIGPVRRICKELGLKTSNYKPVIIGERFGYLQVIAHAPSPKTYKGHFESKCIVLCHCGKQKEVFNYNLRSGNTKTCGCKIHLLNPNTPYIRIFHSYHNGAASRGLEWNLSLAQLKYLVHMKCFYCHAELSNGLKGRSSGRSNNKTRLPYMGIDRVDSTSHYVAGNVLPACWMCNRAKHNAALTDFTAWLKRLGSSLDEKKILTGAIKLGRTLEHIT